MRFLIHLVLLVSFATTYAQPVAVSGFQHQYQWERYLHQVIPTPKVGRSIVAKIDLWGEVRLGKLRFKRGVKSVETIVIEDYTEDQPQKKLEISEAAFLRWLRRWEWELMEVRWVKQVEQPALPLKLFLQNVYPSLAML